MRLALLCAAAQVFSQAEAIGFPRIEVKKRTWDFGTVPPRGKVTHGFLIKNAGRDSLCLVKVRITCSCATAPLEKKVLAPGDTTRLEVTFDSRGFFGPVSRVLYLQSNDSAEPMLELGVSATVGYRGRQLEFEPLQADFDTVRALPARMSLRMKNIDSVPVAVSLLETSADFYVRVPTAPVAAGGTAEVEMEVKRLTPGRFEHSFTLVCGNPQRSRYTIPVRGYYVPAR